MPPDAAAGAQHPQRQVEVVISGFGSFRNVPANPTARLVSWLRQQYLSPCDAGPGAGAASAAAAALPRSLRRGRIHSCTILKVSARAVNAYLVQQLEELKHRGVAACASCNAAGAGGVCCGPPVVLLLHFGADVHRPWFNLETRAINNATFRSPDEDGWHPTACPITTVPGMPLDCALSTDLDLPRLHRHLRGRGHDVQLSADAGKFVCNWTYYNSLALCREAMAVAAMAAAAAAGAAAAAAAAAAVSECGGLVRSSSAGTPTTSSSSSSSSGASSSSNSLAAAGGSISSGNGSDCDMQWAPAAYTRNGSPAAAAAAAAASAAAAVAANGGLAVHSLFVHVPAFESISEAKQQRFAVDLIEALCDQLHVAHWGGGGGEGAAAQHQRHAHAHQRHSHQRRHRRSSGSPHRGGAHSAGYGSFGGSPWPALSPPQPLPHPQQQQQQQQQQQLWWGAGLGSPRCVGASGGPAVFPASPQSYSPMLLLHQQQQQQLPPLSPHHAAAQLPPIPPQPQQAAQEAAQQLAAPLVQRRSVYV